MTGASRGIGREIAGILAERGHEVVLAARDEGALTAEAASLAERHGVPAHAVAVDLTERDAAERLRRRVADLGLSPGILVNNAGIASWGPFVETPAEKALAMIRLNVEALAHLTRLFLPAMIERKRGRILNLGSTAAFPPGPLLAVYYASKAFVVHFSESLDEELRGTGVTATAFCPGPVRTGFQERAGMGRGGWIRLARPAAPEDAARRAVEAMDRGKRLVVSGGVNRLSVTATRFLPRRWTACLVHRIQKSRNDDAPPGG
ncbi:MAG: SDR family oxidoreductase [Candidatus Eisenbacteria bacterium]